MEAAKTVRTGFRYRFRGLGFRAEGICRVWGFGRVGQVGSCKTACSSEARATVR